MKKIRAVVLLTSVLTAIPCFAGGYGQRCSPAGTWYGSNDALPTITYLLTIVENGPRTYTMTFQGAFSLEPFYGTPTAATSWSGELVRIVDSVYTFRILSLENFDVANFPPAPPVINGVEGRMEFPDCETAHSEITFFGVYAWGDIPFESDPILEPPTPIFETYHRLPWSGLRGERAELRRK